jgi:hypothetical protein
MSPRRRFYLSLDSRRINPSLSKLKAPVPAQVRIHIAPYVVGGEPKAENT